jgi:hypothetical protein
MAMNSGNLSGPVVERAGQAEAVLDEDGFARAVALIHAADLRDGGVAFIDERRKSRGRSRAGCRAGAGRAAGEVARVVFDALAEAHFLHHLEVVFGAHFEALGFDEFAFLFETRRRVRRVRRGWRDGAISVCRGGDELFGGEDVWFSSFVRDGAGEGSMRRCGRSRRRRTRCGWRLSSR